jgi:hypothetical protein
MAYEKLLASGNIAQLERLQQKQAVGYNGWDNIDYEYAKKKIEQKINILQKNIGASAKEVRSIMADIANFAHMVILSCDNFIIEDAKQKIKNQRDIKKLEKKQPGGVI